MGPGSEVGAVNIRIGATIQGLLDGMKKAAAITRSVVYDINSKLADSYKRAAKEQSVFRGGLTKLGDELTSIGGKMALVGTLPAVFAVGQAYKDFAELEKLEKGLTRYGESIEKVREIAKLPNIGIFDGAKSLISLKAMKLNSDLATRSIKAFANAITDAGGSAIDLEPALINLRQFVATKHINQVDLRQLAARMPQTYDALEAAFGTQDVEKLNEKMAKIGVQAFIDKFVTELEKIPKAGGGAATAMEQLADSTTILSAEFGKGADNAFGITEKISGLTAILDGLGNSFRGLTPDAQKSIFALGSMLVIVPALITGVGGLIKLLPLLTGAIGATAGAVGLSVGSILAVGAAIGVAAAAIITNWDSIKKFLSETSWWNTLVGIAKATLGAILETFKVVINLIQGDWTNLGKAIVNIVKNISNFVVTTLGAAAKAIVGAFSTVALGIFRVFDKDVTNSDWYRGINSAVGSVDTLVDKLSFDVPDSFGTAGKAFNSVKGALDGVGGAAKGAGDDASDASGKIKKLTETGKQIKLFEGLGKWFKEQQQLKEAIKSYKELVGVTANLNVERLKLSKPDTFRFGNSVQDGLDKAKQKGAALADLRLPQTVSSIDKNTAKVFFQENVRALAAIDLKSAFGSAFNSEALKAFFGQFTQLAKETNEQYQERVNAIADATGRLKASFGTDFDITSAKKFFSDLPQLAGESAEKYAERIGKVVDASIQLSRDLSNALQGAASEIAVSFGEMLGNLMTGAGGVEDFAKRVIGTLGGLLKDMGKSLIAAGTAGIALKLFAKNPYLALAAGIGLVALGTATTNKINNQVGKATTRFAKGGFAYEEMTAIVGDNPNSRNDPEMIAPYSKVHESIKKSIKESTGGGGQVYIADVTVRGEDLRLAFKRAENSNRALTGKSKWA